jgi:putative ABC transport system permease protein
VDDEILLMDLHFADYDFQETFDIEMIAGRWFSREFGEDKKNYVLNEAAVKAMGLTDPVGKWFRDGERQGTIIGVAKDFHTGTLRNKIAPTYFMPLPNLHVMVRIGTQDVESTVAYIEKTWKEFVPERPINLQWLDSRLADFYADDQKLGRIVTYYTGLSLLISCLGLLGLVSFLAEQKTKEIGVRKVLGAPIVSVIGLMTREYVVILVVSSLIAWPIAYWIASRWLAEFAYNAGVGLWVFPAALVSIFLVAFLSVGYKTLKAALQNPIDSLRYE